VGQTGLKLSKKAVKIVEKTGSEPANGPKMKGIARKLGINIYRCQCKGGN